MLAEFIEMLDRLNQGPLVNPQRVLETSKTSVDETDNIRARSFRRKFFKMKRCMGRMSLAGSSSRDRSMPPTSQATFIAGFARKCFGPHSGTPRNLRHLQGARQLVRHQFLRLKYLGGVCCFNMEIHGLNWSSRGT